MIAAWSARKVVVEFLVDHGAIFDLGVETWVKKGVEHMKHAHHTKNAWLDLKRDNAHDMIIRNNPQVRGVLSFDLPRDEDQIVQEIIRLLCDKLTVADETVVTETAESKNADDSDEKLISPITAPSLIPDSLITPRTRIPSKAIRNAIFLEAFSFSD
jgi:hypothetical protein